MILIIARRAAGNVRLIGHRISMDFADAKALEAGGSITTATVMRVVRNTRRISMGTTISPYGSAVNSRR
jgi:hypothetical protein